MKASPPTSQSWKKYPDWLGVCLFVFDRTATSICPNRKVGEKIIDNDDDACYEVFNLMRV
jgi:hypothetical protein